MTVICLAAVCLFQLLLQVGVCWKSEVVSLGFSMMLYTLSPTLVVFLPFGVLKHVQLICDCSTDISMLDEGH